MLSCALRDPALKRTSECALGELRKNFFGIHIQVFDRLRDDGLDRFSFLGEGIQRGDDGGFGIHFEEAAQVRARVAAAKTIRAQRDQAARNPRRDLVRHDSHIIRDRNEHALLFLEQVFHVGFFRRLSRDAACSSAGTARRRCAAAL